MRRGPRVSWSPRLGGLVLVFRAGLAVLAAMAVVTLAASPAAAHAEYVSSSPTNGETVAVAPDELSISFSESVEQSATHLSLLDEDGQQLEIGRIAVAGRPTADTEEPVSLSVGLPPLAEGIYRVQWSTLSSDDLHITEGTIVFGIGDVVVAPDAVSVGSNPPEPTETALRWIGMLGLAMLVGGSLVDDRMNRTPSLPWRSLRQRLRRWIVAGAVLATLAQSFRGADALLAAGQLTPGGLLSGDLLSEWLGLLAAASALGLATMLSWFRMRRGTANLGRPMSYLGYAATVVGVLLVARHGHPATAGPWSVVASATHLLSAAGWLGAVLACAGCVAITVRQGDRAVASDVLRAATPVAVVTAVLAVATGLFMAGLLVPSVNAVRETAYGRAILVKIGLIGIAAVLGAFSAWHLRRRGAPLHRILVTELGVLASVALVAAVMASSAPPSELVWAPTSSDLPSSGAFKLDSQDLLVTVQVDPNRPGDNFVTVGAYQTRLPSPGDVEAVKVSIADGPAIDAVAQPENLWVAPTPAALSSGAVDLEVTIDRAGMPETVLPVTWRIAPAAGTEIGGARLAPFIWWILSFMALAGGTSAWWMHRRGRRRKTMDEPAEPIELVLPLTR